MYGNRRSEYEEEVPGVNPAAEPGYGRAEGVYEEDPSGVPYGRPEYEEPGEGRRERLYERERREEYGQPGYGGEYGRAPGGYGGYGAPSMPPAGEYVEPDSDLGMGMRDSGISDGRDYGAGYGRPGVQGVPYGGGRDEAEVERLQQEVAREKRHEREAEAAAAAGVGFGLYERHERKQDETGYTGEKKHHGFFGL